MMKKHLKTLSLCAFGLTLTANQTSAALLTFDDRAIFELVTGPQTLENFNHHNTDLSFETSPLDLGDFTLSFVNSGGGGGGGGGTRAPLPISASGYNIIDSTPSSNEVSFNNSALISVFTKLNASFFITFDTPIYSFGGDFQSFNDDKLRTRVIAGNQEIDPSLGVSRQGRFWGIVSDTPFTQLEFRGVDNDVFGLDNIVYTIPEPSSIALLAIAGLALIRKK